MNAEYGVNSQRFMIYWQDVMNEVHGKSRFSQGIAKFLLLYSPHSFALTQKHTLYPLSKLKWLNKQNPLYFMTTSMKYLPICCIIRQEKAPTAFTRNDADSRILEFFLHSYVKILMKKFPIGV